MFKIQATTTLVRCRNTSVFPERLKTRKTCITKAKPRNTWAKVDLGTWVNLTVWKSKNLKLDKKWAGTTLHPRIFLLNISDLWYHTVSNLYTMLQKLSKCEVKTWLWCNLINTVTQILHEMAFWWIHTVQKCYLCRFSRFWILILVNLSNF